MTLNFSILPLNVDNKAALQHKINQKTKPLGALGQLETLALKIGLIQDSLSPVLENPSIVVFAGDHGISAAGVSAYPPCVTTQMVTNFLTGGAAVSVFAKQNALELVIVDAGVSAVLPENPLLKNVKIDHGTRNFLVEPAMTMEQCLRAIQIGSELVLDQKTLGCNAIGFGEMGIGNTSSASLIMHRLTQIPLKNCIGRGTGLNDQQFQHKLAVLGQANEKYIALGNSPLTVLSTFGGFEIAMMVGAYLKAAELKMLILVDGFIASCALLIASQLFPAVLDYCVFSHVSDEAGHRSLLRIFQATPLLDLKLRLGEGSAVALAYPLVQSAVTFLNDMVTFEEAGVSQ